MSMMECRLLVGSVAVFVGTLAGCSSDGGGGGGTSGTAAVAGNASTAGASSVSGGGGAAGAAAGSGGNAGASLAGTGGISAGGSGGGGGSPMPAKPTMVGDEWAFTQGEVTLQVAPNEGGRITAFKLGGENVLTGREVNDLYWGSTLWIAPEATLWMQPPPEVIDSDPYTTKADATTLTLTSMTYEKLGVSVTKVFSTDPQRNAFKIEYRINNTSQSPVMMSPWEVTRVAARGLTFFPKGPSQRLSMDATLPTTEQNGIVWYSYDPNVVMNDSKLWADSSEGWVAHIAANLVFIKKFEDLDASKLAPMEGDVELYTNKGRTYIEIEGTGPYVSIAPGASSSWIVTWYLRRLPAAIQASAGSMALSQFVREAVK